MNTKTTHIFAQLKKIVDFLLNVGKSSGNLHFESQVKLIGSMVQANNNWLQQRRKNKKNLCPLMQSIHAAFGIFCLIHFLHLIRNFTALWSVDLCVVCVCVASIAWTRLIYKRSNEHWLFFNATVLAIILQYSFHTILQIDDETLTNYIFGIRFRQIIYCRSWKATNEKSK